MTYSIVARDPNSGELGVAAATALLAVGALVPHVGSGVGAIATQGFTTNPFFGIDGLRLLADGHDAEAALAALVEADPGRERRQAIVLDADGGTAGWTGGDNVPATGQRCLADVAVAGNMLAAETVLDSMITAFEEAAGKPLADRLMAAMRAGEAAGGDRRGTTSAALRVAGSERYATTDLRVDDHPRPIDDLARLLDLSREAAVRDFIGRLPTREEPGRS